MRILKYISKRVLMLIITMLVLITIIFFLFRILPGNPISMYIDSGLDRESQELLLRHYGLDKPYLQQYIIYLKNLIKGDLGNSFQYGKPAIEVIYERFWNTMILMLTSIIIAFAIGITMGAALAWKRGTKFDFVGTIIALIVRCIPAFWTGMILLSVFSYKLNILPAGGMHTPGNVFENFIEKYFNLDFLKHMILPTITSAFYSLATPLLVMRTFLYSLLLPHQCWKW